MGVVEKECRSPGSATVGDCNGDLIKICLSPAAESIRSGGSSGVRGVLADCSWGSSAIRFALSVSILYETSFSSPPSYMLLVGVGGS